MGFLARDFRPSGRTYGSPPPFLSVESRRRGTHGIKPRQQPPSVWQVSFNPSQPDLSARGEVARVLRST
jgi:hypothetical protein